MAFQGNAATQYQQNSVLTANPAELTLMLYKGLVKFLKLAITSCEQNDIAGINLNLVKSQDIVRELLCTLNMKVAISKDLAAMYEYMLERMIQANINKNPEMIKELLGYAEEFRDTWAQAVKAAR
jgi:flagellar protein FliS